MAAKNVTFRLDENLKKQAELIFESMGLTMSSALQLFITQSVSRGTIPFPIEADQEARRKAYVLRELAEARRELEDPSIEAHDVDRLLQELEQRQRTRGE